jgi:hypothetical protein
MQEWALELIYFITDYLDFNSILNLKYASKSLYQRLSLYPFKELSLTKNTSLLNLNLTQLHTLICSGNALETQDIVFLLTQCPLLSFLNASNSHRIHIPDLNSQLNQITPSSRLWSHLDFVGVGSSHFASFDDFHDYWFHPKSSLLQDLRTLHQLLTLFQPLVAINPSICSHCQENTSYPTDHGLTCLQCHDPILWVCDHCEKDAYRICYPCVDLDPDQAIETVACLKCIQSTELCPLCGHWQCSQCTNASDEGRCELCLDSLGSHAPLRITSTL